MIVGKPIPGDNHSAFVLFGEGQRIEEYASYRSSNVLMIKEMNVSHIVVMLNSTM